MCLISLFGFSPLPLPFVFPLLFYPPVRLFPLGFPSKARLAKSRTKTIRRTLSFLSLLPFPPPYCTRTTIARCTYTNGTNGIVADLCTLLRTVLSFDSSASYYLRRRRERKSHFRPKRTGGPKEKKWGHEDWAFAPRERERERERPPIFIRRRRAPNKLRKRKRGKSLLRAYLSPHLSHPER